MKKYRIIIIILLSLIAIPSFAQTYSIRSYDKADVKIHNTEWRAIRLSDIMKLRLHLDDKIRVNTGTLAICKWNNSADLRIAYPGEWSVRDIWNNKALPSETNTSSPGDVEKAESVFSLDFYTADGQAGNSFKGGDVLSGIALTNLGYTDYFFDLICIDNGADKAPVYRLPFKQSNNKASKGIITVLPFMKPLVVDNQNNTTIVYIIYSNKEIYLPSLPSETTEKDLLSLFDNMGIRYATITITYDYE